MARVHRFNGRFDAPEWEDVAPQPYDLGDGVAGTKRVLVGPADGAANFAIRYFEVREGGTTSLDRHAHDHGIVIVKGRARVLLGGAAHEMAPGDVAYIPPEEEHRLENAGTGPLGFLCVNPGRRGGST